MVVSAQENEMLTQVGQDTPMGELLRRYWYPVAASSELGVSEPKDGVHRGGTKAVRLLGEDLVLFRDLQGRLGLVEPHCAHRRVNLVYGMPEPEGIRCPYHGWMYDVNGRCVQQPYEDLAHPGSLFKETIRLKSYPVQELGGLVFAYLGPEPAPLLPRWDRLIMENAIRDIEYAVIPCNWLQIMENSADTLHVLWLHAYYTNWITGGNKRFRNAQDLSFELTEYGLKKQRLHMGETEWSDEPLLVFPNILHLGNQMQIRIPMDDYQTLHIMYTVHPAPAGVTAPPQEMIPWREVPMHDAQGRRILDFNQGQDTMAWVTQGDIARRDLERLAPSDLGLVMYRRLLQEQLEVAKAGGDPMNVFRDPAKNEILQPVPSRNDGRTLSDPVGAAPGDVRQGGDAPGRRGSEAVRELVEQMYAAVGRL